MADINSPDREKLHPERGPEKESSQQSSAEKRDVEAHSQDLAQGIEGVVEGIEDAEGMATGEVAEKSKEGKKKASGAKGGTTQDSSQVSTEKTEEPQFEVMLIQVRTQLKKEIAVLEKEAKKVKNSPYEFALVMQKIRRLRDMLAELVDAASEKVKSLWREYVKKT